MLSAIGQPDRPHGCPIEVAFFQHFLLLLMPRIGRPNVGFIDKESKYSIDLSVAVAHSPGRNRDDRLAPVSPIAFTILVMLTSSKSGGDTSLAHGQSLFRATFSATSTASQSVNARFTSSYTNGEPSTRTADSCTGFSFDSFLTKQTGIIARSATKLTRCLPVRPVAPKMPILFMANYLNLASSSGLRTNATTHTKMSIIDGTMNDSSLLMCTTIAPPI